MLKGYKTYLAGFASIVGAVCAYLAGDMSLADALGIVVPAIVAITVRAGAKDDAQKVIDSILNK